MPLHGEQQRGAEWVSGAGDASHPPKLRKPHPAPPGGIRADPGFLSQFRWGCKPLSGAGPDGAEMTASSDRRVPCLGKEDRLSQCGVVVRS